MEKELPTVCVDLDGTIAEYYGWKGLDNIGEPIKGAKEFLTEISKFAKIIIHTARICGPKERIEFAEDAIRKWLIKNELPFHSIHLNQGKPIASAYIDDRAVSCEAQISPGDYKTTMWKIRRLCE